MGAVGQDVGTMLQKKSALIGKCPDVVIKINEILVTFVMDTGSQVTVLSQSLLNKYLGSTCLTNIKETPWLTLRLANGLKIPYIGYALVDCRVEASMCEMTRPLVQGQAWVREFTECHRISI